MKYEEYKDHFLKDNNFQHSVTSLELTRREKRDLVNKQLREYISAAKKIRPLGDTLNGLDEFFTFLLIPFVTDEGLSTKLVVSMALYYKTIQNLGTERHQIWKDKLENGEHIGCFGLTELAHGSDVMGIKTSAFFDTKTKEFILNTPDKKAMKFWIGGAAETSTVAVIFANLYINNKNEGPHAFLVQIRNLATNETMPGIILGDCGKKIGIDGIDNGFIILNNYRVPRENLLNRFSDVTESGEYVTKVPQAAQRLAMSLGALSQGRILVLNSANTAAFYGVKIGIRYACMRSQFSASKQQLESPLIEYQLHQHRLFPIFAKAVGGSQSYNFIKNLWGQSQKNLFKPKNFKLAQIHAIISCIKAQNTWNAVRGLQEVRESCGGLGFSFYARVGELKQSYDVNQTWEGDNNVLLQQTGKFLLELYRGKVMGTLKKKTIAYEWISTESADEEKCDVS